MPRYSQDFVLDTKPEENSFFSVKNSVADWSWVTGMLVKQICLIKDCCVWQ